MKQFCRAHYFAASVIAALISALLYMVFFWLITADWQESPRVLLEFFEVFPFFFLPITIFMVYPIILTAIQLFFLFVPRGSAMRQFDLVTLTLGVLFTILYVQVILPWDLGDMIYPFPGWLLLLPLLLGFGGYLCLTYLQLSLPLRLLGWAGMLLACGAEFWWYSYVTDSFNLFLLLLPVNVAVVTLRSLRNVKGG